MSVFTVDLNNITDWNSFQSAMNEYHQGLCDEIENISKELNISYACARDVVYLRTRSRHTQEMEERLIQLHREGTPPNVNEFS